ncbi:glutathione S-transferase T1-like [Beta vulgaris subsp. vulgaris]|uniref:glutathione S-transferase T1-like n=1 Tax=Beta vulgaris subsp. vulgaris TaxID=3555 RepID=UPI00254773C1|nr:glutathione S-transferase T1-like [Beta vulgaris subsp. vulgaris]
MATLKIYADRRSQPTRAVILFCKVAKQSTNNYCRVNGIAFEEVETKLFSNDLQTPEYYAINPLKKLPAIAHGEFTLFESHSILMYLACAYHVPDHWYPTDLCKRAKLQSVLDWHHTNLRAGAMGYLVNTILAPFFGEAPNLEGAAECERKLVESFSTIEKVWLKGDAKFLLGNDKPSIADLSLVSEIMQLHMLSEEERCRMIGPYKKVQHWIANVKEETNPHFDEVHKYLFDVIASFKQNA